MSDCIVDGMMKEVWDADTFRCAIVATNITWHGRRKSEIDSKNSKVCNFMLGTRCRSAGIASIPFTVLEALNVISKPPWAWNPAPIVEILNDQWPRKSHWRSIFLFFTAVHGPWFHFWAAMINSKLRKHIMTYHLGYVWNQFYNKSHKMSLWPSHLCRVWSHPDLVKASERVQGCLAS